MWLIEEVYAIKRDVLGFIGPLGRLLPTKNCMQKNQGPNSKDKSVMSLLRLDRDRYCYQLLSLFKTDGRTLWLIEVIYICSNGMSMVHRIIVELYAKSNSRDEKDDMRQPRRSFAL